MIRSPDWRKARAFVATGRVAFGAPPRDIRLSCRSLLPRGVNVPCALIVFALKVACKEQEAARQANGRAAQPSRRLHVPAYLTRAAFETRGAEAPSQRTAPGRLQRRVRPPLSAERFLNAARATPCTTRSRRQHAPVTRGSRTPEPPPVLRARASRDDFARSRPSESARNGRVRGKTQSQKPRRSNGPGAHPRGAFTRQRQSGTAAAATDGSTGGSEMQRP